MILAGRGQPRPVRVPHNRVYPIGVPLLVQHYVQRFSRELGREVRQVALETLERLRDYAWPGNIRELQSVLKQALLQASGTVLLPAFLPELAGESRKVGPEASERAAPEGAAPGLDAMLHQRLQPEAQDLYAEMHREVDRFLLPRVLEYTEGSQHQAARLLGIARKTLRQKLSDLGLHLSRALTLTSFGNAEDEKLFLSASSSSSAAVKVH